jgi:hypothetical protein
VKPAKLGIVGSTTRYEAWLGRRVDLVTADLEEKHRMMAADHFGFFRATYYRWIERWPAVCGPLDAAPVVPSVADAHVENFGTWRDAEARLVWGVNDFDEASSLPYTQDLVRLAASAIIAIEAAHLRLAVTDACLAVADGYAAAMAAGGSPFVLAEHHAWLRGLALGDRRDPVPFWHGMQRLPALTGPVPADAARALEAALPPGSGRPDLRHRVAGAGSLGRPRFVALAVADGAAVAREAKAVAPSACDLVRSPGVDPLVVMAKAVRDPDPSLALTGRWVLRRLAPDCGRIELASLPAGRDERRLLAAMGSELANIHLGDAEAASRAAKDLARRPARWLHAAAAAMVEDQRRDWTAWRRSRAA